MLMTGESITDTGSSHNNHSTTDLKCEIAYLRGEFSASDKLDLSRPVNTHSYESETWLQMRQKSFIFPVDLSNSSSLVQDVKG